MLIYLIKTVACMAILFFFYKLLLERESMHVFKRFYLLFVLVFSLIIPALVFTEYVEVVPAPEIALSENQPTLVTEGPIGIPEALEADVLDVEPLLWGIYFIGLTFFAFKFIKNLWQISGRIRKNPKRKAASFTNVLLKEIIPPHTFFNYIFLNKKKFESHEIPKEVLLHEQTHAQQKHSIDVVLVELLHVLFWFNPFLYFLKKSVKLNHEFLADHAVLKNNIDKTTYQNTLLSYLSPDSEKKYQPLANAINYSSIKKRFTIMKTHTSKKAVLLRSFVLLPLLAILLYGFSETNFVQIQQEGTPEVLELKEINTLDVNNFENPQDVISEKIEIQISENGLIKVQNEITTIDNVSMFLSKFNSDLTKKEKANIVRSTILIEKGAPQGIINGIHDILTEYGSATIDIVEMNADDDRIWIVITNENEIWVQGKVVQLDKLSNKLSVISSSNGVENNVKVQIYSEGILKQDFLNQISEEIEKVGASSIQVFTEEYVMPKNEYQDQIDRTSKTIALKANKITFEDISNKESATQKQISKYNSLAKKYNVVPIEKRSIPLSDLKILETVFRKMNQQQKTDAQPFPECLPKNVQDGASRELMKEYNSLAKKYNNMLSKSRSIQIKMKDVNRLEYIYGLMSKKQRANAEAFPDFPEPPPAPNAPRSPNEREEAAATIEKIIAEQDPYDFPNQIEIFSKGKVSSFPAPSPPKKALSVVPSESSLNYAKPIPPMHKSEVSDIPPPPTAPKVLKGEVSNIPPPPPPIEPLDYVIAMTKKNARFYYEGKEISSDKAIALMKKNKDLNIESRSSNGKVPVVKLSTEPIVIEN